MIDSFRPRCPRVVALAILLSLSIVSPRVTNSQQRSPQPPGTEDARFDDLSSVTIYTELQARGLDPLQPATSAALRRAYVKYDFATGGGHNLQSSESSGSIQELNAALSKTAITSDVSVRTKQPGARIKYRLVAEQQMLALPQLTNNAEDTVSIGLYSFWSERDGNATSKPETFRIIKPIVVIEIEEVLH